MKRAGSPGSRFRVLIASFVFLLITYNLQLTTYCAELDISTLEKLFLEGRYEKAIEIADELIDARTHHRDEIYYLKALSELKANRFAGARQSFERILSRYQRSARSLDAQVGIGDSYFLEGNIRQALKIYNELAELFPDDKNLPAVFYRIGNCYSKLGEDGKAKSYFEKARNASPFSFEVKSRSGTEAPGNPAEGSGRTPDIKPGGIPRSETGQFISVQVGSFRNKKNATRLTQKLSRSGYDSYLETPAGFGETLYRVKVGRLKSGEEANVLASRLNADGYRTKICNDVVCE